MFDEDFFQNLEERITSYKRKSGQDDAALIVRARFGLFHVKEIHPEDSWVGLFSYAQPTDEDAESGPAKYALVYLPYGEIVSVEIFPGAAGGGFAGSIIEPEAKIGF